MINAFKRNRSNSSSLIRRLAFMVGVGFALHSFPSHAQQASAQQTPQMIAALQRIEINKATKAQVDAFLANPNSIIITNPTGGQNLSALVESLLLADPSLAVQIAAVAQQASTSDAIATAIGAGMGAAAQTLQSVNPQAAASIQTAVASASSAKPAIQVGFTAGAQALTTLSVGNNNSANANTVGTPVGGGAGVVGGAGGGPGVVGNAQQSSNTGGAPASQSGSTSTPNSSPNFAGLTNSGASVSPR